VVVVTEAAPPTNPAGFKEVVKCVEAVKMKGGLELVELVKKLTTFGIPVMGHMGLLPQRDTTLSGYRVQGKDAKGAVGAHPYFQGVLDRLGDGGGGEIPGGAC
jgi:hypothetical protein